MNTTISMSLGVAFVVLGVAAVFLQAWLWHPRFWDAANKRTMAPRLWLGVHRAVGYAFFAIYVVMMWQMVPRLWQYQVELPARTILHAVAAIVLGVLLATKIAILKAGDPIREQDIPFVVGYLVAITPEIQTSMKSLVAEKRKRPTIDPALLEATLVPVAAAVEPPLDVAHAKKVTEEACTQCHDMDEVEVVGGGDEARWAKIVKRMVIDEGARVSPSDGRTVVRYLALAFPKK